MLLLTWSGRKLKFDKFLSTTWEKQIEDRVFHGYDIHNCFLQNTAKPHIRLKFIQNISNIF